MIEKVSIITISYNSEKTIEKTFQSVLTQTYRPLEYVLVDGGSKDGTIGLIEKYIPIFRDNGIEVNYQSEPDKGISDAFNKGIERSSGKIIGIINSDDCLVKGILDSVVETFEEDTDVVCGDCLWVDSLNGLEYIRKSKLDLNKLKYEMVLMHPTCFVRKRTYERYGMFDTKLKCVMDKDLMSRFYRNGAKFKYIPKVIAIMSAGGISDADTKRVFQEGIEVAVRNGVPRWKAKLHSDYKGFRIKIVGIVKKSKILWKIVGK